MAERPEQPDSPKRDVRSEFDALPDLSDPMPEDAWWLSGTGAQHSAGPPDGSTTPSPGPDLSPLQPGGVRINLPQAGPGPSPATPRATAPGRPSPSSPQSSKPPFHNESVPNPFAAQPFNRTAHNESVPNPPVAQPFDRPLQTPLRPGRRGRRAERGRRGRGPRWLRIVRRALAVLVLMLLVTIGFSWYRFRQIETVPLGDVLTSGSSGFTNYLIVGTDSREGIDPDDPNAAAILGTEAPTGQRTDALMIMQVRGAETSLLSLPRDLIIPGDTDRINTVYARSGPTGLVTTIQNGLGIPIHHYAEVDMAGFLDLVSAAGGVTITFDKPARDLGSGLFIDQAGEVRLDETQALAYVRSRKYEELDNGVWKPQLLGDLDRVVRQQAFIRAVASEVAGTRSPAKLVRFSGAMARSLRVDDETGYLGVMRLGLRLRGFQPASTQLPVVPFTTADGRAVLGLGDNADAVLAPYRA